MAWNFDFRTASCCGNVKITVGGFARSTICATPSAGWLSTAASAGTLQTLNSRVTVRSASSRSATGPLVAATVVCSGRSSFTASRARAARPGSPANVHDIARSAPSWSATDCHDTVQTTVSIDDRTAWTALNVAGGSARSMLSTYTRTGRTTDPG